VQIFYGRVGRDRRRNDRSPRCVFCGNRTARGRIIISHSIPDTSYIYTSETDFRNRILYIIIIHIVDDKFTSTANLFADRKREPEVEHG